MDKTVVKILREIKSLFIIILIALALRAMVVEAYIVPTGSMEDTIMTGDFLIGNKFVYGMRTPDWIGIPYTEIGFPVPWTRFPKFKEPKQGDVVIFKYPRDQFQKYVKRCVAGPGQTVEVREKRVFVDGQEFPLPAKGKFVDSRTLSSSYNQSAIFLRNGGNRDTFGPIRVPKKGDRLAINGETNWDYVVPLMIMDGHEVTLEDQGRQRKFMFTMRDPDDVARRYLSGLGVRIGRLFSKTPRRPERLQAILRQYYSQGNPSGVLLNVWKVRLSEETIEFLRMDGVPVKNLDTYTIAQNYYWMMGDNRDDSADSRYWGFVPRSLMLGEAVFVYMSWDFEKRFPRLYRIGKIVS